MSLTKQIITKTDLTFGDTDLVKQLILMNMNESKVRIEIYFLKLLNFIN